jgi:hypothetical protein
VTVEAGIRELSAWSYCQCQLFRSGVVERNRDNMGHTPIPADAGAEVRRNYECL